MSARLKRQRSGATAVEFAIVSPILFMILFGCIEIGLAHMILHTTEAAAYEAARVAIIPGKTSKDAKDAARRILGTAGVRKADIQLRPNNLSRSTKKVTVTISTRYRDNLAMPTFFVNDNPIVKQCVLQRERVN